MLDDKNEDVVIKDSEVKTESDKMQTWKGNDVWRIKIENDRDFFDVWMNS